MGMYGDDIQIEANKEELLKTLRENRDKHVKEYKEACVGYMEQSQEVLEERLKVFQETMWDGKGLAKELHLDFKDLPRPQSHEKDYDRAIKMLEMHCGETFKVDMDMYQKYIEDNWSWKRNFKLSTARYLGG